MELRNLDQVVGRKRYRTNTATLLADDVYWDGNNHERSGRNTFLLKGPGGSYFAVYQSMWQGETDRLNPLSVDEAVALYEQLSQCCAPAVPFEEAFPQVKLEEA